MDANIVVGIVAWVLSLLLEVIPGFTDVWEKISPKWKPLLFLGFCVVIAFVLPLLSCVGVDLKTGATCPPSDGIVQFITTQIFIAFAAWGITQATFTRVQDKLGKNVVSATNAGMFEGRAG